MRLPRHYWPGVAIIGNQAELLRHTSCQGHFEGHRPEALGAVLIPQRDKHDPLHPTTLAGLHGKAEDQPLGLLTQCEGELRHLHLLPAERPVGRFVGCTTVEAHRHAMSIRADDKDEMGGVVEDLEPRVLT